MSMVARVVLAFCVLLVFLATGTPDVEAHAALARSDPPVGATLADPPAEIRLWFTEPLEERYTRAQVLDAAGDVLPAARSAIAPDDDHQLVVTLPPDLPDGGYTVAWRTLSAADGHTLDGYFGFQIGAGTAAGVTPAVSSPSMNDVPRALTRALALVGLAALLAIAPITLGVLDPAARATPALAARMPSYLRRYAVAAAAVALLGSIAALAAQTATIAPDVALPVAMGETLTATRYGQIWLLRLVGLLLVMAAVAMALRGRSSWRRGDLLAGTLLGLVAPVPFSLLSHAAAQPVGQQAAIAADALHLLAAAIWGGGLLLLALVLVPALRPLDSGAWREALRVAIPRFSFLALAAWGVLLLSGLYSAWLQVGTVAALTDTPYGQSLLLKGILLIPVLALAAFHLLLGWRGAGDVGPRRVAATIALEALLVIMVLLVVGRLIGQEPAREVIAKRAPTQLQIPLVFATEEEPRTAQLTIAPGAAGPNTFTLDVAGAPLPADAESVLRFALPERNIGEQELRLPQGAANHFATEGSELTLPGDWRITAIVRAIGAFSWTTEATVTVGAAPPIAAEPNPAPHFGPGGVAGMVALAIGLAGLAAAALARGTRIARRAGIAAIGTVALAAGVILLVGSRLPAEASVPVLARSATPEPPAPAAASPPAMSAHDHDMVMPHAATPVSLPGVGTPVPADSLVVTVTAEPAAPGPTDITVDVRDPDGAPLPDARVVVFAEMAGMGQDGQGTPAEEVAPGRYVAPDVSLSMSGDWQLKVRVLPKGQPTRIIPVALTVPANG
jgi:copper transport protein